MSDVSFWIARPTHYWMVPGPVDAAFSFGKTYEDVGYQGLMLFDTQNLAPEVYVALTAVALQTRTLHLGTGVTNATTRHAAVTASAISTLQALSGGRAYLGIGRGDSALAHIGYAPAPPEDFERYLAEVCAYMRGEEVAFAADSNIETLGLRDHPSMSRLQWADDVNPVPVGVAASGPRVISAAARQVDRVDLMLSASAERVRWGIDTMRTARTDVGLDPAQPVSAYVHMIVHDDPDVAWQMAGNALTSQGRFATMHGKVHGPASNAARSTLENIHTTYDMTRHAAHGSGAITAEFAHEFGIYGPSSYCVERLQALVELGVDRFILAGCPDLAMPVPEVSSLARRFVEEVLPQF